MVMVTRRWSPGEDRQAMVMMAAEARAPEESTGAMNSLGDELHAGAVMAAKSGAWLPVIPASKGRVADADDPRPSCSTPLYHAHQD